MSNEIWQYRIKYDHYSSIQGWSEWMTINDQNSLYLRDNKIADIRYWISKGHKYQLRRLTQDSIEGYEVEEYKL